MGICPDLCAGDVAAENSLRTGCGGALLLFRYFFLTMLTRVHCAGFEKPSAIQQRAIVPMSQGRDVIAQSQSGTGKTAMLSIVSLQLLDTQTREIQVRQRADGVATFCAPLHMFSVTALPSLTMRHRHRFSS